MELGFSYVTQGFTDTNTEEYGEEISLNLMGQLTSGMQTLKGIANSSNAEKTLSNISNTLNKFTDETFF